MPLLACPAVRGKTPRETLLDKPAVAPELSETDFFNGHLREQTLQTTSLLLSFHQIIVNSPCLNWPFWVSLRNLFDPRGEPLCPIRRNRGSTHLNGRIFSNLFCRRACPPRGSTKRGQSNHAERAKDGRHSNQQGQLPPSLVQELAASGHRGRHWRVGLVGRRTDAAGAARVNAAGHRSAATSRRAGGC